jgi:uroporphyrinogen-III synthase
MRLLVTRPEPDAGELAAALRDLGQEAVVEPLLRVEYLDSGGIDLEGVAALAATSRNGLRALARLRETLRAAIRKPIYVVGPGTEALARQLGFAEVLSADGDSAALAKLLALRRGPESGTILHLSGSEPAGDLASPAAATGLHVRVAVLYRMVAAERFSPRTLNLLQNGEICGALLMSPRTTRIYLALTEAAGIRPSVAPIRHFCLSEAVAAPLRREGFERISVASRPNTQELLALIAGEAAQSAQKS